MTTTPATKGRHSGGVCGLWPQMGVLPPGGPFGPGEHCAGALSKCCGCCVGPPGGQREAGRLQPDLGCGGLPAPLWPPAPLPGVAPSRQRPAGPPQRSCCPSWLLGAWLARLMQGGGLRQNLNLLAGVSGARVHRLGGGLASPLHLGSSPRLRSKKKMCAPSLHPRINACKILRIHHSFFRYDLEARTARQGSPSFHRSFLVCLSRKVISRKYRCIIIIVDLG